MLLRCESGPEGLLWIEGLPGKGCVHAPTCHGWLEHILSHADSHGGPTLVPKLTHRARGLTPVCVQVVCVLSRDDDPRLSSFQPAGLRQLLGQVQPAGAAMPQQNCLAAVTLGNLARTPANRCMPCTVLT